MSKYKNLKLNRELVKLVANAYSLGNSVLTDIAKSGIDISTVDISKDAIIGDGYIHFHSEHLEKANNESVTALAKSFGINKLEIATSERISELLSVLEGELNANNVFVSIHVKENSHNVVMLWKRD